MRSVNAGVMGSCTYDGDRGAMAKWALLGLGEALTVLKWGRGCVAEGSLAGLGACLVLLMQ